MNVCGRREADGDLVSVWKVTEGYSMRSVTRRHPCGVVVVAECARDKWRFCLPE